MRGEMQQIGRGLQAGTAKIVAIARNEARTTAGKMVTPRAATNELRGSAPAGEDRVSQETCWMRHEVTRMEKLIGVTETCTSETGRQVTELTETREVETNRHERLHGEDGVVGDTHTHTHTHT